MSATDRTEIHRMATKIALSFARGQNQPFDAFPMLFRVALNGLLSCTVPPPTAVRQPPRRASGRPNNTANAKYRGHRR
jgi:hypothetical protein